MRSESVPMPPILEHDLGRGNGHGFSCASGLRCREPPAPGPIGRWGRWPAGKMGPSRYQRGARVGELLGGHRGQKHLNGGKLQLPPQQPRLPPGSISLENWVLASITLPVRMGGKEPTSPKSQVATLVAISYPPAQTRPYGCQQPKRPPVVTASSSYRVR